MFVMSELCFLSRCLLSHPPGVNVHSCMVCRFVFIHCKSEFIKLQVRDNTLSGPVYGHVPTMVGGMCSVLHCTPLLTLPAGVCLRSICKLIVFDDTAGYVCDYESLINLTSRTLDCWC